MDEYIGFIEKSALFKGLSHEEVKEAVIFFDGKKAFYKKGAYIYRAGDEIKKIGFVLSGTVCIEKEDYYGNRSITARVSTGDIFGEVYACMGEGGCAVSAAALSDTNILFLDTGKMLQPDKEHDKICSKTVRNLLSILANKALLLNRKIEHISKRTTREKLMSFFSEQAVREGNSKFDIDFNRQELADFLCVDRSAMSSELSRMKKEGIINFDKNHFQLLNPDCSKLNL